MWCQQVHFERQRHGAIFLGLRWDFVAKNQFPGHADRLFTIPLLSSILGTEDLKDLLLCPVGDLRIYLQASENLWHSHGGLFFPLLTSVTTAVSRTTVRLHISHLTSLHICRITASRVLPTRLRQGQWRRLCHYIATVCYQLQWKVVLGSRTQRLPHATWETFRSRTPCTGSTTDSSASAHMTIAWSQIFVVIACHILYIQNKYFSLLDLFVCVYSSGSWILMEERNIRL